jgi:hypothetical protein
MYPFIVYWIRFYPKQRISQGKKKKGSGGAKAGLGLNRHAVLPERFGPMTKQLLLRFILSHRSNIFKN